MAVTQVGSLPPAPQRNDDPDNFIAKADTWVADLQRWTDDVNTLGGEVDTLATETEDNANQAAIDAANATNSAAIAASNANFVGNWEDQTGAANVPLSVYFSSRYWQLLNDLADITDEPPVSDNLILYSEQLDNGVYVPNNCTISPDAAVAPDGNTTADKIVESSDVGITFHVVPQTLLSLEAGFYTVSIFIKAAERANIVLKFDSGGNSAFCDFDVAPAVTGTPATTGTGVTPLDVDIIDEGNDWYRCVLYIQTTISGNFITQIFLADATGNSGYIGDGVSGLFAWGVTVSNSPYLGEYIPTTNEARSDVVNSNWANIPVSPVIGLPVISTKSVGLIPFATPELITDELKQAQDDPMIHFVNGFFIMGSSNTPGTAIYTSADDGETWIARTMPVSKNWAFFAYLTGNSRYLAIATDGACYWSTDFVSWTVATTPHPGGAGVLGVACNGTEAIVFDTTNNTSSRTVDGDVYVTVTGNGVSQGGVWSSSAGLFLSYSSSSTTYYTSPTGVTWTARTAPTSQSTQSRTSLIEGEAWIGNASTGQWWKTSNGIDWTLQTTIPYGTTPIYLKMYKVNDVYICHIDASGEGDQGFTSTDLVEWVKRTVNVSSNSNLEAANAPPAINDEGTIGFINSNLAGLAGAVAFDYTKQGLFEA